MKNLIKLFSISIALLAFSAGTFAQVTGTARAEATIITPITITWVADLNFGNLAAVAAGGTVTLDPATGTRTPGAGITFLTGNLGTITRGQFTVAGNAAATYSITLPGGATTIGDGAAHTMTVDNWTSSPTPTGTIGAGGNQTLYIGGRLNVGVNQASGAYTSDVADGGSGNFSVTVNYN